MTRGRAIVGLALAALAVACGGAPSAPKTEASPAPAGSSSAPMSSASAAPAASSEAITGVASPSPSSSAPQAKADAPADKPSKISARHILIQWMGCEHAAPSVVRTRDQALAVAQEVLRRAKAGEDFARLAVEFSDEPNAGQRGGSLGRFGHGQMVKAFEDAAFALKPGEISGIVETGFGFHVIQRTE